MPSGSPKIKASVFHPQLYPESRTSTYLRVSDIDAAMMIFLYDTFGQGESESPSTFLSRISRHKDTLPVIFGNTLARIGHIYDDKARNLVCGNRNLPFALHRINGILAQVFYDPLKEGRTQLDLDRCSRQAADDFDLA